MATDPAIPLPSQRTVKVVWLDVNTRIGLNGKPDLLPNVQAINNSLFNLFTCPIGSRGPIFQPEYGTSLYRLLHDPIDNITANKIRAFIVQAIQRWEPRIEIDLANSFIRPNYSIPGYEARLGYNIVATNEYGIANFQLSS
jgi:phage baseplate assembly protein W